MMEVSILDLTQSIGKRRKANERNQKGNKEKEKVIGEYTSVFLIILYLVYMYIIVYDIGEWYVYIFNAQTKQH